MMSKSLRGKGVQESLQAFCVKHYIIVYHIIQSEPPSRGRQFRRARKRARVLLPRYTCILSRRDSAGLGTFCHPPKEEEEEENRCSMANIIHSVTFRTTVSIIILVNVFLMGIRVELKLGSVV